MPSAKIGKITVVWRSASEPCASGPLAHPQARLDYYRHRLLHRFFVLMAGQTGSLARLGPGCHRGIEAWLHHVREFVYDEDPRRTHIHHPLRQRCQFNRPPSRTVPSPSTGLSPFRVAPIGRPVRRPEFAAVRIYAAKIRLTGQIRSAPRRSGCFQLHPVETSASSFANAIKKTLPPTEQSPQQSISRPPRRNREGKLPYPVIFPETNDLPRPIRNSRQDPQRGERR